MIPKINLIEAKSILTKSGLPGTDWVINPYNGCLFSCMYCYAAQIARWRHPDEEWGSYLDVKTNAPEVLRHELRKMAKRLNTKNFGSIFFSSVTDPYVGLEAKYRLTGKCLEELADFGYEGEVSILTKSPLVLNDIDILKKLKNASVGFTVTSIDDEVSRFLEIKAPPVSARITALKKLHEAGVDTYAFVGPVLPSIAREENKMKELLDKLEEASVKEVWFEHINLNYSIKSRLYRFLRKVAPDAIIDFDRADTEENRGKLEKVINRLMQGRSLKMGMDRVIRHL